MTKSAIRSVRTPVSELFGGALVAIMYMCVSTFIVVNIMHLLSMTAGVAIALPTKIGISMLIAACIVAVDLHIAHEISLVKGQRTASELGLATPPEVAKGAKARLFSRAALGGAQAAVFVPVTMTMMLEPDIRDYQDRKQLVVYADEYQATEDEIRGRLERENQKAKEIDEQIKAMLEAAPPAASPNKAVVLLSPDLAHAQRLLATAEASLINLRSNLAAADRRLMALEADPAAGPNQLSAARADARAERSAYNAVLNERQNYQNRVTTLQRGILAGEKDAAKANLDTQNASTRTLNTLRDAREKQAKLRNKMADDKDQLVADLVAKNPQVIPPSHGPAASMTALWQMMFENFGALILGIAIAAFATLLDVSAVMAQVFSTGRATHLRRYLLSQEAVMELEDIAQGWFASAALRRARRSQELAELELERKFWTDFMSTQGEFDLRQSNPRDRTN